jgi:uncharacterized protein YjbI with pentapeptide repeats
MKPPTTMRRRLIHSTVFLMATITVLSVLGLVSPAARRPMGEVGLSVWRALKSAGGWYHDNRDDITPMATFIAWAALRQAKTARLRHERQTEADWQRRITESFSKAAEQLGSDKIEVRLGGIYTMERISRESPPDYWPVMETLAAFVRERSPWGVPNEAEPESLFRNEEVLTQPGNSGMPTDIAAVLSVISRRETKNRQLELKMAWSFDLCSTDLRRAQLHGAHLERAEFRKANLGQARLREAHLEGAVLREAHLEKGMLWKAHLEEATLDFAHLEEADLEEAYLTKASLVTAHLEGACLSKARLQGAILRYAHLDGAQLMNANFEGAHLKGADLWGARLEGAHLHKAVGLTNEQLETAIGDASTTVPEGLTRPAHWSRARL